MVRDCPSLLNSVVCDSPWLPDIDYDGSISTKDKSVLDLLYSRPKVKEKILITHVRL